MQKTQSPSNYKLNALKRIQETTALRKNFQHLAAMDWAEDHSTWKWLSESPLKEVLEAKNVFSPENLRAVSIQSASTAVLASLMGLTMSETSSIPLPELNFGCRNSFPIILYEKGDYSSEFNIWLWRICTISIAGIVAEDFFTGNLESFYYPSVDVAISLINSYIPTWDQRNFFNHCLSGAISLVSTPTISKCINEVNINLFKQGKISSEIALKVVQELVFQNRDLPEIIQIVLAAVTQLALIDATYLSNLLPPPEREEQLNKISVSFLEDFRNISASTQNKISSRLKGHLYSSIYWLS